MEAQYFIDTCDRLFQSPKGFRNEMNIAWLINDVRKQFEELPPTAITSPTESKAEGMRCPACRKLGLGKIINIFGSKTFFCSCGLSEVLSHD